MAIVTLASVMITGASSGIGKEVARQLALREGMKLIYLAVRSEQRGLTAMRDLEKSTGKSIFKVVVIDISDPDSVRGLVKSLPAPVDALVMNAGGFGGKTPGALTKEGVTHMYANNLLGHVVLLEGLIAADKLAKEAIFIGSEAARGVPRLRLKRPDFPTSSTEDIVKVITGQEPAGRKLSMPYRYGEVKYIAALWMSEMARQHPNLRLLTVSPGSTKGTKIGSDAPAVVRFLVDKILMPGIFPLFNLSHSLAKGTQRIIDVLTDDRFQSGHFYASRAKVLNGPLIDQSEIWEALANPIYQANAMHAVHSFV